MAQKVPPVPDRLLATRGPAQPEAPAPEPAASADSRAVQPIVPANVWPLPKPQETAAAPSVPPPPVIAVPAPPPPAVIATPSIGQAQAAQPQAETPRAASDPQEAVARGAAQDQGNVAASVAPPVRTDTRVVVRTNSWIELRSPAGDVLAQSYVRAGESYTVPAGISYRIIDAR